VRTAEGAQYLSSGGLKLRARFDGIIRTESIARQIPDRRRRPTNCRNKSSPSPVVNYDSQFEAKEDVATAIRKLAAIESLTESRVAGVGQKSMAAVRRPSCFLFMRAELSDCLFGFGDLLSLI
jgi:hypothetical protein